MMLALRPAVTWAGMPLPLVTDVARVLRLTDSSRARLEAISFFLVILLLAAVVVRWLWNRLTLDFPKLPRITYAKSLGVVVTWGLLFLVVLTMIAATREMMMPGVWEKQGLLYRIPAAASAVSPTPASPQPVEQSHESSAPEGPRQSPETQP